MSNIEHPKHYNIGKHEVWDIIDDWDLGWNLGNVVKYTARARHKGTPLIDLKKAQQYLEREIAAQEKKQPLERLPRTNPQGLVITEDEVFRANMGQPWSCPIKQEQEWCVTVSEIEEKDYYVNSFSKIDAEQEAAARHLGSGAGYNYHRRRVKTRSCLRDQPKRAKDGA